MAKKEELFVGLDVGSSKISVVVGKETEESTLEIIGVGNSALTGISKGTVKEIEETVSGISEAIEIAERMAGVALDHATVNVNGGHINSIISQGVAAVGRADQEVSHNDVIRAEEAAQAVQIPPNKEIIHVLPRNFTVDDQTGIIDPTGMTGVRLEVEANIIVVSSQETAKISKCVSQTGIKIEDMIISPLAAAKAVLTKRQKELGCAVIDIGAETTGLAVYEEGTLLYTRVFSKGDINSAFGAAACTYDLNSGLQASSNIDIAEKVKLKYGHAWSEDVPDKGRIDLSEIDIKAEGVFTRKYVSEICEARMEEILETIHKELKKINRDTKLPAGIIITGGGAKIPGIEKLAKKVFKLPVEVGKPHSLSGITEKVYDPRMSVSVGLALYAFEEGSSPAKRAGGQGIKKLRDIFKTFLP
jgi:cell division protein FtsA